MEDNRNIPAYKKIDLINALFEEFEKDKNVIKDNLMMTSENIVLKASNNYGTITMNIKIEREIENENIK